MSDKENLERKLAANDSRWEAIQLTAANAQRELDYAIAIFEKHEEELSEEDRVKTSAQIEEQRERVKDYLMKGRQAWQQDKVRLTGAIARLEGKNASIHL